MKSYKKPVLNVECFTANEFVANSCGDSGVNYLFECNARGGFLYYYPHSDGKIDGEYTGSRYGQWIGFYTPCHDRHEASSTDGFYDGYVDYNMNGRNDKGEGVIVWRGKNGQNGHATKNLNMDEWQIAKS